MIMRPRFSDRAATRGTATSTGRPRRSIVRNLSIVISVTLILSSTISGCSPLYLMRAAYEEGKILWRREPIPDVIARPDTGPDTQEKLKLVLNVREFARDRLKLNVGGSFSSFSYVDRPDLTYIV